MTLHTKALEAAEKSYHNHFEGRPMVNAIQTYLDTLFADKGLEGEITKTIINSRIYAMQHEVIAAQSTNIPFLKNSYVAEQVIQAIKNYTGEE